MGTTLGGVAGSHALAIAFAFASEAAPEPAVSEFAAAGADHTLCFLKYSSNTPRNRLASPSSLAAAIVATLMSYSFPLLITTGDFAAMPAPFLVWTTHLTSPSPQPMPVCTMRTAFGPPRRTPK